MDNDKLCEARPKADVLREVMDVCRPKSEHEWVAAREIESLRARNAELEEFIRSISRRKVHMGWAMWRYEATLDLDDARNPIWERVQDTVWEDAAG